MLTILPSLYHSQITDSIADKEHVQAHTKQSYKEELNQIKDTHRLETEELRVEMMTQHTEWTEKVAAAENSLQLEIQKSVLLVEDLSKAQQVRS